MLAAQHLCCLYQQSGFLALRPISASLYFSGQGLSAGLYGALLAGFESTQGRYPLTLAFLDFVSELIYVSFTLSSFHVK